MTTIQMIPPSDGRHNSISFDGRTYSSSPGVSISVPSFDVPVLGANGWQQITVLTGNGSSGETWAGTLRRLAASGAADNPFSKGVLVGSVPWVTGTVYAAGAVVSNAGNAYKTAAGGRSGATAP